MDDRGLYLAINAADEVINSSVAAVINGSEEEGGKRADLLIVKLTEVENRNQVYANGTRCIPLTTPVDEYHKGLADSHG